MLLDGVGSLNGLKVLNDYKVLLYKTTYLDAL